MIDRNLVYAILCKNLKATVVFRAMKALDCDQHVILLLTMELNNFHHLVLQRPIQIEVED